MGLFSSIGGFIGASKAKKASKKAQAAELALLQKAIDLQSGRYDEAKDNFQPYQEAGTQALGQQSDILGMNGDPAQQSALDGLKASPFYQSLFNNGQEAVLQNAAATGGIRGGNTQRGLADFGYDSFATTIQQQLANLGGLSGQGLQATNALGNIGQGNANSISSLYGTQGDVTAKGILNRGALTANMWGQAGGLLDQAASAFIPGGSGFGQILSKF